MRPRQQLEQYIADTLGVAVRLVRWRGAKRLPIFLADRYALFEASLLELDCLFAVAKEPWDLSPAVIRKHVTQIQASQHATVVYVCDRITAYNRKRLIDQRVPFVVPGNQMYLPMLGIDLREHFWQLQSDTQELSPSAQVVLLHAFLGPAGRELTAVALAPKLGYSTMTIGRAFDQLEALGLARSAKEGRARSLVLTANKADLWSRAQTTMRSPVKRRYHARPEAKELPGPCAGLSGLARRSTLAEPAVEVIALAPAEWNVARRSRTLTEVPTLDAGVVEVEIWSYVPKIFSDAGVVDPLSLFLSLREADDERIQAALEEMMGAIPWQ